MTWCSIRRSRWRRAENPASPGGHASTPVSAAHWSALSPLRPEGLKAVFKDFNEAGEALVKRLQAFRQADVHVLGSFIFGLPTDTAPTFAATADLAQRAGVSVRAVRDVAAAARVRSTSPTWEREATDVPIIEGVPLTRYWLIPPESRPRCSSRHPSMTADEVRSRTQGVWDRFYALNLVWTRSRFLKSLRARLAFVLISKLYHRG